MAGEGFALQKFIEKGKKVTLCKLQTRIGFSVSLLMAVLKKNFILKEAKIPASVIHVRHCAAPIALAWEDLLLPSLRNLNFTSQDPSKENLPQDRANKTSKRFAWLSLRPEHSPSPAHHTAILVGSPILPEVGNPGHCCCQGLSCLSHHNKHNLPGRCRRHLTAGKPCSAHGRYSWWHLGGEVVFRVGNTAWNNCAGWKGAAPVLRTLHQIPLLISVTLL